MSDNDIVIDNKTKFLLKILARIILHDKSPNKHETENSKNDTNKFSFLIKFEENRYNSISDLLDKLSSSHKDKSLGDTLNKLIKVEKNVGITQYNDINNFYKKLYDNELGNYITNEINNIHEYVNFLSSINNNNNNNNDHVEIKINYKIDVQSDDKSHGKSVSNYNIKKKNYTLIFNSVNSLEDKNNNLQNEIYIEKILDCFINIENYYNHCNNESTCGDIIRETFKLINTAGEKKIEGGGFSGGAGMTAREKAEAEARGGGEAAKAR